MTDEEFEIIDELYFIISFEQLIKKTRKQPRELKSILLNLIVRGWVRCIDEQMEKDIENLQLIEANYNNYYYVASKQGLLVHNSR